MDTLAFIVGKYGLELGGRLPVEIPNVDRAGLAALFAELGFRVGVEVGVEQGLYSEVLCRANPGLRLYGVDAWEHYAGYRDHVSQVKLDGFYLAAKARLVPYDCTLVRKFSVEAAADFELNSLDFVYIDGNHALEWVIADIAAWLPRIRPGGIIAGHDYRKTKGPFPLHVVFAVQAYTQAYRIRPWFVLGRRERWEGEVRDTSRSWMWVKDGGQD